MGLNDFAGFGTRGYRSFASADLDRVGPMAKTHLIVGKNNVGKSNILHFASDVLPQLKMAGRTSISRLFSGALDMPTNWNPGESRSISIALNLTPDVIRGMALDAVAQPFLSLFKTPAYSKGDEEVAWFDFTVSGENENSLRITHDFRQFKAALGHLGGGWTGDLAQISRDLTATNGPEEMDYNLILNRMAPWQFLPSIHWVDAIREIKAIESNSESGTRNGNGLIQVLAELENPELDTHADHTAKFNALQEFVRNVLEDPSARVQIPGSKTTIFVHLRDGVVHPLEGLGTGISEVILIAAVATGLRDQLICIEEPELHLHPALQRKLVEYLHHHTTNHYLMSTHSAQLLDFESASISHVTMTNSLSRIEKVLTSGNLATAVLDLGNRASDLVQSNFVVWVEGPSDRLYLRHWIEKTFPRLREGAHYSILFYGGALLNHLSADEENTNDFISLLRVNRNLAVVIDSDRSAEDSELNATKLRIIKELDDIDAVSWVTDGYTIENYVPREILEQVIADEYPRRSYRIPMGEYASPLGDFFVDSTQSPEKVRIARAVVNLNAAWDVWPANLRARVESLSNEICAANGI